MSDCAFCDILTDDTSDTRRYTGAGSFVPLNPVTEGHRLVVPYAHRGVLWELSNLQREWLINAVSIEAQEAGDCNVIQSNGAAATQTVEHVHFHIVPRREKDALLLPWTNVKTHIEYTWMLQADIAMTRTENRDEAIELADGGPVWERAVVVTGWKESQ